MAGRRQQPPPAPRSMGRGSNGTAACRRRLTHPGNKSATAPAARKTNDIFLHNIMLEVLLRTSPPVEIT